MATDFSKFNTARAGSRDQAVLDEGLRSYMLKVYNYMASGLALSGITAALTASTPAIYNAVFGTPLQWVVMLAPIGLLFAMMRTSASTTKILYWIRCLDFLYLPGLHRRERCQGLLYHGRDLWCRQPVRLCD